MGRQWMIGALAVSAAIARADGGTGGAWQRATAPKPAFPAQAGRPDLKENVALQSGVPADIVVPPGSGVIYLDDQFTIEVPAGTESLWVELAAEDVGNDFDLFVRYNEPVAVEGQNVIADAGSTSLLGYEEVGLWGGALQVGTYYVAIGSFSDAGGGATLTATLDAAIVDLESGAEIAIKTPSDNSGPSDYTVSPDGHQFRFTVPDGTTAIYIRFQADDLGWKAPLAARYMEPCAFTGQGLLADAVFELAGGFIDVCLQGIDVQPGNDLYLWPLNDSGADHVFTGRLAVVADRCFETCEVGVTVHDIASGPVTTPGAILSARQYRVALLAPTAELEITVAAEGSPADLDLFVRRGEPVAVQDGQAVADFSAQESGTDPETLVIECAGLTAAEYYIAIGNPNARPVPYALTVAFGRPCGIAFRRGDVNADTQINIADAIALLSRLFGKAPPLKCDDAGDANDDGGLNIADAISILAHLFANAGPLKPPFETPGTDPTTENDTLGCACYSTGPCP